MQIPAGIHDLLYSRLMLSLFQVGASKPMQQHQRHAVTGREWIQAHEYAMIYRRNGGGFTESSRRALRMQEGFRD